MSIIITLAGFIAMRSLPVAQYPEITPPTVEVSAIYPGANAHVVADTVAAPIEQQVNGVEGMLYMSSQCTNDGAYALTITFQHGVDLNIAQVLVPNRVGQAIEAQNVQVAAGQIGQPPMPSGQAFQYTMTTLGRLVEKEQFAAMILKTNADGNGVVTLGDVAKIDMGAQTYDQTCTMDGQPSVALSVYQLPGSNALEVARLVRAKVGELKTRFPQGV